MNDGSRARFLGLPDMDPSQEMAMTSATLSSWQGQSVPHLSSSLTMRIVPEPLAHDQTALIVITKPTCGAGSQLTLSGPCGSSCWIGRASEPSTCSRAFTWYGTKGQ